MYEGDLSGHPTVLGSTVFKRKLRGLNGFSGSSRDGKITSHGKFLQHQQALLFDDLYGAFRKFVTEPEASIPKIPIMLATLSQSFLIDLAVTA